MKLSAIIVDDELKLRRVFTELLRENCPEIEIIGEADNIQDAYDLILSKKPSVVFLDIEMPGGNGFDLLAKFPTIFFETIFVTSYGHYAIQALKLSALDYLLKPVSVEHVASLTERIKNAIALKESAFKYNTLKANLQNNELEKKLVIQSKDRIEQIIVHTILYLKAEDNYTLIFLENGKKIIVSKTLKEYEEILCEYDHSFFIRTHKSYIVNAHQIKLIERGDGCSILLKDNTRLEVARRRKTLLMDKYNSL
jgi:two-component system LytT family response regulator